MVCCQELRNYEKEEDRMQQTWSSGAELQVKRWLVRYLSEYCTSVHNHHPAPASASSCSFHDVHSQFSSALLRFSIYSSAPESKLHLNGKTVTKTTTVATFLQVHKNKWKIISPESHVCEVWAQTGHSALADGYYLTSCGAVKLCATANQQK
jgi:hypothetical protein